jgi:ADP-heptose:LPS heptosyltransferase
VIEGSSLVVANDSAALHMAVGFDRPLVALFGPTRVELVGPFRREADVLQHATAGDRFEHKELAGGRAMMERISVDEVLGAIAARASAGVPKGVRAPF